MRVTETSLLADRIVFTIRWLTLLGFVIALSRGLAIDYVALGMIVVTAIWNLLLTFVSLAKRRLPFHTYLSIGIDVILGILFFLLTGTTVAPFVYGGLLPVLTGAFYFGLTGGVVLSIGVILVEGIILISTLSNEIAVKMIGLPAGVIFITGIVVGVVAQQISYLLRDRYDLEVSKLEESERIEREKITALYNITASMTASLNYERVLDMALDLTSSALAEPTEGTKLVGAVCLYHGEEMYIGSARRFTPSDLKVTLTGQAGIIAEAMHTGDSQITKEPDKDPEVRRIVALRACGEVYCAPLRTSGEVYGAMLFGHPDPEYFNDARREILEIVSRQALVALQNARLYRDLEEEKERMMEIQEEARKKLARDLHDGPTQSVAAIAMRVNFARRMMERDERQAAEELFKIEDLARRTTKEIRQMLFTLRPLVLETAGLISAIESMAEKMRENYGQNVIVEADPAVVEFLEMGKQSVIFYIAEEAVNNARKHAGAEHIWVRLRTLTGNIVLLEIEDDGVGFNIGEMDRGYEKRGSLGMVNMRERTELINGVLRLESQEGKGTRIRVWVPLNEDAADRLRHANL